MYKILPYTYKKAKELKVLVYSSDIESYKIKVYDLKGKFMFYGGNQKYSDYPYYIESHGQEYADAMRLLYRQQYKKDIEKVGSRGYYIANLLW